MSNIVRQLSGKPAKDAAEGGRAVLLNSMASFGFWLGFGFGLAWLPGLDSVLQLAVFQAAAARANGIVLVQELMHRVPLIQNLPTVPTDHYV